MPSLISDHDPSESAMSAEEFHGMDSSENELNSTELVGINSGEGSSGMTNQFNAADLRGFHSDDAMAGGMIGAILSMAFLVLLGLVTAVNFWMWRIAGT